jgi:hypothetical protein
MAEPESTAKERDGKDARPWHKSIKEAEKAFDVYQDKCDNICKLYADLQKIASTGGDRQFQIFWANLEILRPSIYQRAPQPVVMPRHSDTGQVPRKASELLERALEFDVEADDLHETLLLVRDDLALCARGVPWVLDNGQCIHVDRHDFLHEPARKWQEVGWVARRVYLDRDKGVARFGKVFKTAEREKMGKDRDDSYFGSDEKAPVWEIWDKNSGDVIWVAEGIDQVLDRKPAFVKVKGFFPCPKPAYATVEPGTLKPVPDFIYYRDQVDEIHELTARISALSESLRMKGFYAAGTSEIGEAIETAMKQTDNRAIMVPVSNFAALGGNNLKDSIVWLPVVEIANVIASCVELRKQLISDVYEITGLSDIMRGVTEADETLGAQNLKAEFGSIRVREKQSQMVRVALDVLRIKAEIMAENFSIGELMEMAGMRLPAQAEIEQAQAQGQEIPPDTVTAEQVDQLLKSERLRPFALDIETDSTIAPNEQAEKANRIEFLRAVGEFLGQSLPLVQQDPTAAPFMGELLRFGVGAFRAGRDMGGEIDQFVDQIKQRAKQAQGQQEPSPEAMQAQVEGQRLQLDGQRMQLDMQKMQLEGQIKQAELQIRNREVASKEAEAQARIEAQRYGADLQAALKAQDQRIKMMELGVKVDEQRMKEAQQEIDAMMNAAEIELEATQERAVGIGD